MTRTRALLGVVLTATTCLTAACFGNAAGVTPPQTTPPPTAAASPTRDAPTPSSSPKPSSSPSTSPKPSPQDEVTKTVSKYYRVLDELSQKPPRNPYKKLFTVTTGEEFEMWQDVLIQMSFDHQHAVGDSKIIWVKHGKVDKKGDQRRVRVRTCLDMSGVDVLDKNGKSVVAKDRQDRVGEKLWMVSEKGSWYVEKSRDGDWKC